MHVQSSDGTNPKMKKQNKTHSSDRQMAVYYFLLLRPNIIGIFLKKQKISLWLLACTNTTETLLSVVTQQCSC